MSSFDSTKDLLNNVLNEIVKGEIQLPDFQRGWVWDDDHILSLLVSIARSFPIGSVMLLENGGEAKFQVRPVEGVNLDNGQVAERLILDGQQRLTSLTQVIKLNNPINTYNNKGKKIRRFYYIDIEKSLQDGGSIEDAFFSVDESKIIRENFGRDIKLDLSTEEEEFNNFLFSM